MKKDYGKIALTPGGLWNADTAYEKLTTVSRKGQAYLSLIDNVGVDPEQDCDPVTGIGTTWFRIATKGDPGTTDYNELINKPTIPTALADLLEDATHRLVTDEDKTVWNGKYSKPSTGIPKTDFENFVQQQIDFVPSILQYIEAIAAIVPEQASAENQLADKDFVNSSVSTATADFKGTYNSLEDLEQVTANANDYAFVIANDAAGNSVYKRYKWVEGTGWTWEYDLNNSSFTAAQWAAIQSGITLADVEKLSMLPSKDQLEVLLGQKQDELTFDNNPTSGSNNPVTSDGIKRGLDGKLPLAGGKMSGDIDLDDHALLVRNKNGQKSRGIQFAGTGNRQGVYVGNGSMNLILESSASSNLWHKYGDNYVDILTSINTKRINGNSIYGNGNIDIHDVFVATYGVTPHSDIESAYNAGKIIRVRYVDESNPNSITDFDLNDIERVQDSAYVGTHIFYFSSYEFDANESAGRIKAFYIDAQSGYSTIKSKQLQNFLVSGTNIKSINGNSILGSGDLDVTNVFIATYNQTSINDLNDAYTDGKLLVVVSGSQTFLCQRKITGSENTWTFRFAGISYDGTMQYINCTTTDNGTTWTWGWSYTPSGVKTKSVNSTSTDSQYPSAKAVYDFVQSTAQPQTAIYNVQPNTTTLDAVVDTYYNFFGTFNSCTITLPLMTYATTTLKNIIFNLTCGDTPAIVINGAEVLTDETQDVVYFANYLIEANKSYEINALWNGSKWVIGAAEITIPTEVEEVEE